MKYYTIEIIVQYPKVFDNAYLVAVFPGLYCRIRGLVRYWNSGVYDHRSGSCIVG
jgi:hypothetical protein